jgi:DNA polymerase III epsilon subunit-like protein
MQDGNKKVIADAEVYANYSSYHQATTPVHPRAFEVHGISLDKAQALGVSSGQILSDIATMIRETHVIIGYEVNFDNRILESLAGSTDLIAELLKKSWCVLANTRALVHAVDKNGRIKKPTLAETYRFFFGKDFASKHTSSADAFATLQIHVKALEQPSYAANFNEFLKQILCANCEDTPSSR